MPDNEDTVALLVTKAQAYVEASNTHDLARIEMMLASNAVYRSSSVGDHKGLKSILSMMQQFFMTNPDVHWDGENFNVLTKNCVGFDFAITLGGARSTGFERLYFDVEGLIHLIEVER